MVGFGVALRDAVRLRRNPECQNLSNRLLSPGILVPPSFGVTGTPSQKGLGSSLSIHHRLMQASVEEPLSYFTYLQETDLSTILIKDHMQSGVWVAPQAGSSTAARISVVGDDANPMPSMGHLFCEHKTRATTVQLRASSGNDSFPAASFSFDLGNSASVFLGSTPNGQNWAGAHFDKSFQLSSKDPSSNEDSPAVEHRHLSHYEGLDTMNRTMLNAKAGAWTPFCFGENRDPLSVHGYMAANALGATGAVHASLYENNNTPQIKSYFSANLNEVDRPPLQVSLSQNGLNTSIALTQVLSFDRIQLNVLEDRAPYVRNTAAWTIRMENSPAKAGSSTPASANVALAAAWQVNRAVALKAVYDKSGCTTAVLCKRWEHPRMTCSLLHRWSAKGPQLWGIGLELETGRLETDSKGYYYNHHPTPTTTIDSGVMPPTKGVLPGEHP